MRRIGLAAAGLLAMVAIALALVTSGRARPNLAIHTCSATDRQSIETARTFMRAEQPLSKLGCDIRPLL